MRPRLGLMTPPGPCQSGVALISASESRPDLNSRDVVCSALAIQSSDLTSELVRLRMVLQPHAASHPSSGIFDNLGRPPKASLIPLASLRGLTPESTVDNYATSLSLISAPVVAEDTILVTRR